MSTRISKAYLSKYVTDFDLKHAANLVNGLIEVGDGGYTVISVIRAMEVDGFQSVYDDKHLIVLHEGETNSIIEGTNHADYLDHDEFVRMFATRLKFDDRFFTLVSVNRFDNDPELSIAENISAPENSRHSWYVEQFLDLPKTFGSNAGILPPGFYEMNNAVVSFDGEQVETAGIVLDFNDEDGDAVGSLINNFNDAGEVVEPDSVGWFVGEAGDGFHNVFVSWTSAEGESVGGNVIVQAEGVKYTVESKNRMIGALDYSLFADSVAGRIDEGFPTFVVVQTFPLGISDTHEWLGDSPYEIRGWLIAGGFIRALDENGIREAVSAADEGDFALEHATFVKPHSLDLSQHSEIFIG